VEVWLGEVEYAVNVGELELSQLVATSDLQPSPGQKYSDTGTRLVCIFICLSWHEGKEE
jgi:hypothetical protein